MKPTDDRINYLSHLIQDGLYFDNLVDHPDEEKVLREIKRTLNLYFQLDEEVDAFVHEKIASLKRGVFPGSPEWEVLYRKYSEEEKGKRRRLTER